MALPLSLTQPLRKGVLLVGGGWRGFFTPYNAAYANSNGSNAGVVPLDLQVSGPFNESNPPTNFTDLGWINKFKLTPQSKIGSIRSGYRGAVRAQYRGQVGETVEFSFRESTRLAWKIATGTEIFNLMDNSGAVASTVGPLSSSGSLAVAIGTSGYVASATIPGYTSPVPALFMPSGSTSGVFAVGNYIVCDQDYTAGTYGKVGAAGIDVLSATQVTDVDFIRKTSDFIARVVGIVTGVSGQDVLVLNGPFVGGGNNAAGAGIYGPQAGSKVQKIKGFAAREGGTYLVEWSGLFCMDTMDGSQIAIYYPHLSPNQFKDIASYQIENIGTTDLTGYELDTVMEALAYDDPLDGETVVRYAAYYPSPGHPIQA